MFEFLIVHFFVHCIYSRATCWSLSLSNWLELIVFVCAVRVVSLTPILCLHLTSIILAAIMPQSVCAALPTTVFLLSLALSHTLETIKVKENGKKKVARGLGPTLCIIVVVAHICN